MDKSEYAIQILSKKHNKADFRCGMTDLDTYLEKQAGQDMKRNIAVSYILSKILSDEVIGYYTLSSTSIELRDLPENEIKKLPRYPLLPATLIGRLAVDKKYQGKGKGELLLISAIKTSLKNSEKVASMAVVVDAKNKKAERFYQHFGFIPFSSIPHKMYLSMGTIKRMGF